MIAPCAPSSWSLWVPSEIWVSYGFLAYICEAYLHHPRWCVDAFMCLWRSCTASACWLNRHPWDGFLRHGHAMPNSGKCTTWFSRLRLVQQEALFCARKWRVRQKNKKKAHASVSGIQRKQDSCAEPHARRKHQKRLEVCVTWCLLMAAHCRIATSRDLFNLKLLEMGQVVLSIHCKSRC